MALEIKHALVVDDEEALREIIAEVLFMQDILSVQAANGAEAIKLAEEHKKTIDLLIIDMFMPDMSGEETYRKIREFMPDCKVIFISGYNSDQSFTDTEFGNNHRFLQKPFTISNLTDILSDFSQS